MKNLPINDVLKTIQETLKSHNTLLLQAPPGAGKSTLTPISLLSESWLGNKMIIMLEPRRVAARMVAMQMAKLLGEEIGQRVGYQVKMDSCYTKNTKILVVTEAILVRKLQSNQTLDDVALIIFDEFHERSIHTDLSLALSLQVQELLRDDLKILIMSATLDSHEISSMLNGIPTITSKGKSYDIENIYTKDSLLKTTLKSIQEDDGDILVFLAGVKEIKTLQKQLLDSLKNRDILILPLYSALSKKEQDRAIQKSQKRKIILSTNIAQTSLTIEGIKVVIDSGLEKLSRYNYANGMNHLELSSISEDSATQRAGRAGRLSHGKCYKLWERGKILQASTKAEILRGDLSSLILDLALWGVKDFNELHFLDTPSDDVIQSTQLVLQEIEMLDERMKITPFGKDALNLGVHPRYAYMILKANELHYAYEACLLTAMLGERDIFIHSSKDSNLLSRFIHLFEKDFESADINKFRAQEILRQADFFYKKLKSIQNVKDKNSKLHQDIIAVLLLFAYPDRVAKQRGKNSHKYKLSNAKGATIHMEDTLFNEQYLVVSNLITQQKDSYIVEALSISLAQIEKYFASSIITKESITYNTENKKFDGRESRYFLDLELSSKAISLSKKHNLKPLLLGLVRDKGLELFNWNKKALHLKNRVIFLHHHQKFQDFSDENLLNTLENWLEPYLDNVSTIKDLESLDTYSMLLGLLSWEQQQLLDSEVPKSIKVPSGSHILIDYSESLKPSLHVKIQELFGLQTTPKIFKNSIALKIHLLTPAMRDIQITYDLESFWKNSYSEIRKELRGKYKKHYWPENPYEAIATSKTKKHLV